MDIKIDMNIRFLAWKVFQLVSILFLVIILSQFIQSFQQFVLQVLNLHSLRGLSSWSDLSRAEWILSAECKEETWF